MKLGPVTKLDKKSKTPPKDMTMKLCQKLRRHYCKTYIFINSAQISPPRLRLIKHIVVSFQSWEFRPSRFLTEEHLSQKFY